MRTTIFSLILFVSSLSNVFAEENKFLQEYIDVIKSNDLNKIEEKIMEFQERTEKFSRSLVELIEKETDLDKKAWLIYLTGSLKLEFTTGELIRNLEFVHIKPQADSFSRNRHSTFPVQNALAQIGMSTLKYLINEITEREYNYPDILLLRTIRTVIYCNVDYVDSVQLAKLILEGYYKEEEDPKGKENLKKAIELISQENYLEQERAYQKKECRKAYEEYKKQQKNEVKPETANP